MNSIPLIGIPVDVKQLEGKPFHTVGEKYINAVAHGANGFPLLIPAITKGDQLEALDSRYDIRIILQQFDGIFLPGSLANVDPVRYGQTQQTPELPTDLQRDETTFQLILMAIELGIPLLGVCRGFQEMNVAFGGTLHQEVHNVGSYFDHREDQTQSQEVQYQPVHDIHLNPEGILSKLAGVDTVKVNSIHGQGIDQLGEGLLVEATAPDGLIEAFSKNNTSAFTLAVQWHPEWKFSENPFYEAIFKAFGEAVKKRHESR